MAYFCCFGYRGNLKCPDFLQKLFYNIDYLWGSEIVSLLIGWSHIVCKSGFHEYVELWAVWVKFFWSHWLWCTFWLLTIVYKTDFNLFSPFITLLEWLGPSGKILVKSFGPKKVVNKFLASSRFTNLKDKSDFSVTRC